MNGTPDHRRVSKTLDSRPVPAVGSRVSLPRNDGMPATVTGVTRFPGETLLDLLFDDGVVAHLFAHGVEGTPNTVPLT